MNNWHHAGGKPRWLKGLCVRLGMVAAFALCFPATVQAQTTVFLENFENAINNTATGAQGFSVAGASYVGTTPAGQTYTAATDWLNGAFCNGVILSASNSTAPSWATAQNRCRPDSGAQSYNAIRTLARGMGNRFGGGDNNHVLSAYTECPNGTCTTIGSGATNGVMFRTNSLIPVPANHFYTFSVDIAARSCGASGGDPLLQFQLIDGSGGSTNIGGLLNACGAGGTSSNVANLQTSPFPATVTVYTQTLTTTAALKYTGTSLGVRLYNNNGATFGNDLSVDNIRVLDATPTLSKSFSPNPVTAGGISVLTFTITNTSDGLAKPAWSFTDNLPAGMTLANTTIGGTCTAVTTNAATGASSITINGSLPAVTSCTVTVNVRVASNVTTALQNCPANITGLNFIIAPTSCAVLNVSLPVNLGKTWVSAVAGNAVNLTISGSGVIDAIAGTSTAPSTTTNATAGAAAGSTVTLAESFTNGSASSYATTLACAKTSDGSAVAVSGSGLSRTIVMPTDSGVTCTYTNQLQTNLTITKTNTPASGATDQPSDTVIRGVATTYSIVTTNSGSGPLTGAVVRDPANASLVCNTPVPCTGTACPSATVPLATLQGTGVTLGTLAAGGSVTFTLTCVPQ